MFEHFPSQEAKIMKASPFIVATLALSACATPYVPPAADMKPPPLWAGTVEIVPVDGPPTGLVGVKKLGDAVFQQKLDVSRQGKITEEIRYKDPFGKDIIVPKGTPVHAQQMSVTRTTSYNYVPTSRVDLNADNNPIEWCFKIPTETACIFWEGETRARYVGMIELSQRRFLGFQPSGMVGPMPKIVEGPNAFGGPMLQTAVIPWKEPEGVILGGLVFRPQRNPAGVVDAVEVALAPSMR
jgi:hypothetical protein